MRQKVLRFPEYPVKGGNYVFFQEDEGPGLLISIVAWLHFGRSRKRKERRPGGMWQAIGDSLSHVEGIVPSTFVRLSTLDCIRRKVEPVCPEGRLAAFLWSV